MNLAWKLITILSVMFCLLSSKCLGANFDFVSIEKLVEQEVGRVIIPKIYSKLGIEITITPMPGKRAQQMANSGIKDGEIMRIYSYGNETPNTIRVRTP